MSRFSVRPVFKNNIKDSSTIPTVKSKQEKLNIPVENKEENKDDNKEENKEENNDQQPVDDNKEDEETVKRQVSKGFPPRANLLRGFRTPTAMRGYGIRKTANSVIDCL